MKILTIDTHDNILDFKVFDYDSLNPIINGSFYRIGLENSHFKISAQDFEINQELSLKTYSDVVDILFNKLIESNLIYNEEEISFIAFRVVHGGELYKEPVLISDKTLADISSLSSLAPDHNPISVEVIKKFKNILPGTPMLAVFETAYYQSMQERTYLYPIPYSWYKKHGVRKYGYYGISQKYVYERLSEELKKDKLSIISCRLGNEASITAIKDGEVIDTSMGFTTLAGIMMGSRSGDIDPSIITYIMEKEGKSAGEVIYDLSNKSGFLGLTELTSEVKDVMEAIDNGDEKAKVALDIFADYVASYIAEYHLKLVEVDAICFSAGIGENASLIRKKIIERLKALGIMIDEEANKVQKELKLISHKDSKIAIYVVPSDKHLMLAKEAKRYCDR